MDKAFCFTEALSCLIEDTSRISSMKAALFMQWPLVPAMLPLPLYMISAWGIAAAMSSCWCSSLFLCKYLCSFALFSPIALAALTQSHSTTKWPCLSGSLATCAESSTSWWGLTTAVWTGKESSSEGLTICLNTGAGTSAASWTGWETATACASTGTFANCPSTGTVQAWSAECMHAIWLSWNSWCTSKSSALRAGGGTGWGKKPGIVCGSTALGIACIMAGCGWCVPIMLSWPISPCTTCDGPTKPGSGPSDTGSGTMRFADKGSWPWWPCNTGEAAGSTMGAPNTCCWPRWPGNAADGSTNPGNATIDSPTCCWPG